MIPQLFVKHDSIVYQLLKALLAVRLQDHDASTHLRFGGPTHEGVLPGIVGEQFIVMQSKSRMEKKMLKQSKTWNFSPLSINEKEVIKLSSSKDNNYTKLCISLEG